jgi:diguanylate cyclase (GGDEF)-like protein/putative nucleotidyltransferase with HDIG domain/PAS domain S-box-containing protein
MKKIVKKPVVYSFLVVVFFGFVLFSLYYMSRNALVEKQTQILTLNRDVAASKIENEIFRIETIILNIDSYITTQGNQENFEEYITNISEDNSFLSSIYFGTPDNTMIITSDIYLPPSYDLTTRPWYLKATTESGVVFTDAFLDVSQQKYIVTGAKAVYEEDTLIGVIGIDIDVSHLSTYLNDELEAIGGISFLIDSNDYLIANTKDETSPIPLETIDVLSLSRDLFLETDGLTEKLTVLGEVGQVAYSKIDNTDYVFGVFMPIEVTNQGLRFFYNIGISIGVIIFLGGLTVYYIYSRLLQKPLDNLILDIDQIENSNTYQYRFPLQKGVGLYKAREALNKVLDDTEKFRDEANSNLEKLTLRNQKYNILLDSASDIVFQIDNERRYVEIFGKGLKQLKLTETDFIGKTFEEVFNTSLSESREACYDMVFQGNKRVYSWDYIVDKEVIYFETAMAPLYDIEDNIVGIVGVTRDITEQEQRYQDMVNISTHDYLTGLRNRRFYIERLQILDTMREYPFGVMNIDVNGLKIINDAYGHAVGDEALIKTADVLKNTSYENCIVSRVSGDEFTIILPNSDEAKTKALKEQLLKEFEKVQIYNLNLSVAIGYYIKESSSVDIEEVRMLAENDMFRHKISERKSVKNKAISAILKTLTEKYEAEKKHSKRVTEFSKKLGEALDLTGDDLKDLTTAAMFHDIGKISIPDDIINKSGKLSDREYEIMKSHTEVGYEILRAADEYSELAIHASSHHERWDGKGYPRGLKGEKIPYFSRIICIADSYEAMTADRPYRKKQTVEYATSEIIKFAGTQFDPVLAKVFVEKVLKKPWPEKATKKTNPIQS